MKKVLFLTVVILTLLVAVRPSDAQGACNACADEHCALLTSSPWYYNVEDWGQNESYIRRVDVSTGDACFSFTESGSAASFSVTITTKTVSVDDPSGSVDAVLVYWWADHLATPTPTATIPPPRDTPPPWSSPTPTVTNTPPPDTTATPTEPPVTPTLTKPPLPSPTPTQYVTPTPPPNPSEGTMRGFLFCKHSDGSIGQGRGPLVIETDNRGVLGGIPFPNGYVGTWPTAPDSGTTVNRARPGNCYRGGDAYPDDPTLYDLDAQPIFGAGNVGNSVVVCFEDCIDTSTFYLPAAGGEFANWFVELVLRVLSFLST